MVVSSPYFIFNIALAGIFSSLAIADDDFSSIEVFTDSRTTARNNLSSATVYKVDRIDRLQHALSEGLPSDPETAKQAALQCFQTMDAQISSELENAAAKNYLDESEIKRLNALFSAYFDAAEFRAMNHDPTYMKDWLHHLQQLIEAMGRQGTGRCRQNKSSTSHGQSRNRILQVSSQTFRTTFRDRSGLPRDHESRA